MIKFKEKINLFIKKKYNKNLKELNCKSIINIIRYNNFSEELLKITNTKNIGEGLYKLLNNINNHPTCYCGKKVNFINFTNGYRKFCSVKCMANSKQILNKKINTNLKKYGTEYGLQNKKVREKSKKTWIKKYGVDNPSKNKEIKKKLQVKSKDTFKNNFYKQLINGNRLDNLVKPLFKLDEYSIITKKYKWLCLKCNIEFYDNLISGKIPHCPLCNKNNNSKFEKEIVEWLYEKNIKFEQNNRTLIYPLELDFILSDYKIAIEFDGLYWHNETNGKDKDYHLNKTNLCKEKGYQLIHIFEDEWIEKLEIVKSVILSKIGIYKEKIFGRKCKIEYNIDNKIAKEFLQKNHIQGYLHGYHNGLYYNNELVALSTFSKSRHNKKYDYELLRFCSKLNTQILGGLSKLIKSFLKDNKTLISYADKRYSNGLGYQSSGWNLEGESIPNYWYLKNGNKFSRLRFQKHKLPKLLENFDSNLTEWQNMQLAGYDRIWDCGNYVFSLK